MKPLPLDALHTFLTLCETGSLTEAALRLHKAPSTLSHSLKKLERHLNVRLVARKGPRLQLTEAGRALQREGARLLEQARQTERFMLALSKGWESRLRIAIEEIYPTGVVFNLLEQLYAFAPEDIQLELTREVLGGSWEALLEDRADLIIGAPAPPPERTDIAHHLLGKVKMHFVVAPHHPLALQTGPLPPHIIQRHRVVVVADSARHRPARSLGLLHGQPVLRVATLQQKLEAQRLGLGVGYLPHYLVKEDLARGTLIQIETQNPPAQPELLAAWRTPLIGRGLRWLVQQIQAGKLTAIEQT